MNNRDYKQFAAGEYYHLYNRGNGKMDIFRSSDDYDLLLTRLCEYLHPNAMVPIARARRKGFSVGAFSLVAYCLMPNHFHFLIRQNSDEPISSLMLSLWTGYSKCFNKKYERVGSLFQDQFKAVHVENDEQLKHLTAYIHTNPTIAGLEDAFGQWPYSSCGEYIEDKSGFRLCDVDDVLKQFSGREDYRQFLKDSFEDIRGRKNDLVGSV